MKGRYLETTTPRTPSLAAGNRNGGIPGCVTMSLVPKAGLEPARLAPHAPQTCVSAIPPLRHLYYPSRMRERHYRSSPKFLSINDVFGRIDHSRRQAAPGTPVQTTSGRTVHEFNESSGPTPLRDPRRGIFRCRQYTSTGRGKRSTVLPIALAAGDCRLAGTAGKRLVAAPAVAVLVPPAAPRAQALSCRQAGAGDRAAGGGILSRTTLSGCVRRRHEKVGRTPPGRPRDHSDHRLAGFSDRSDRHRSASRPLHRRPTRRDRRPLHGAAPFPP